MAAYAAHGFEFQVLKYSGIIRFDLPSNYPQACRNNCSGSIFAHCYLFSDPDLLCDHYCFRKSAF
jgi:hypothetical protein